MKVLKMALINYVSFQRCRGKFKYLDVGGIKMAKLNLKQITELEV